MPAWGRRRHGLHRIQRQPTQGGHQHGRAGKQRRPAAQLGERERARGRGKEEDGPGRYFMAYRPTGSRQDLIGPRAADRHIGPIWPTLSYEQPPAGPCRQLDGRQGPVGHPEADRTSVGHPAVDRLLDL
jgi:hypothetical protein